MSKCRTPWSRRANHVMIENEIDTQKISDATGMARQYVAAVVYGRVDSPKARRKISDFLGISDDEDDE